MLREPILSRPRASLVVLIVPLVCCLLIPFGLAQAQTGRYSDVRALVGRVQEDLRRAAGMASPRGKDFQRVDNAQRHLSQFDRALSKGKFDSGKLDASISDVQNVVDHNTLTPQDRDSLNVDLRDLRAVRKER
ncbi:MAG TPA: hypothetical protein VKJ45_24100 [Blastocatellia bacterium]|nr:hypothetical protein [Blastocatellia bacterium]